jgi:hypothetical protein
VLICRKFWREFGGVSSGLEEFHMNLEGANVLGTLGSVSRGRKAEETLRDAEGKCPNLCHHPQKLPNSSVTSELSLAFQKSMNNVRVENS